MAKLAVESMITHQCRLFGLHNTGAALLPAVGGHGLNWELRIQFGDLLPGGNSCCVKWDLMLQRESAESVWVVLQCF